MNGGRFDLDGYGDFLRGEGVPDEHVPVYERAAARIVEAADGDAPMPRHVDEAVRQAEQSGATAQQLANLDRMGQALVRFARRRAARGAADGPAPAGIAAAGPVATAASVPGRPPRADAPPAAPVLGSCRGCGAALFLDYKQNIASKAGGVAGIAVAASVFLCGCLGAGAGAALVAGTLFLGAGLLTQWRCQGCHTVVSTHDLGDDDRRERNGKRFQLIGGGAALLLVGAVLFVGWVFVAFLAQPSSWPG